MNRAFEENGVNDDGNADCDRCRRVGAAFGDAVTKPLVAQLKAETGVSDEKKERDTSGKQRENAASGRGGRSQRRQHGERVEEREHRRDEAGEHVNANGLRRRRATLSGAKANAKWNRSRKNDRDRGCPSSPSRHWLASIVSRRVKGVTTMLQYSITR